MGYIVKTDAGSFRANWRDLAGKQKSKTFPTRKEASAFLADTESALNRGTYVDPKAGKVRLAIYAARWLESRADEAATMARDVSIIHNHVLPAWGSVPIAKVDHSGVQAWVSKLGGRLAPATVRECHRLLSAVLKAAVRDRVIPENPAAGVKLPPRRRTDAHNQVIEPSAVLHKLLPEIPERHRAMVALAAGTGLRWGELAGLRWTDLDLGAGMVTVSQVAVEVSGVVTIKGYPKSRAGRRTVPVPDFAVLPLRELAKGRDEADEAGGNWRGLVFTNTVGEPLQRGHFRGRVWRPALVRAGLLGQVAQADAKTWRASWRDATGKQRSQDCRSEREARALVARMAQGGLRFHDLRHSYATWLVSSGVPLNDVARVMGHEHISTTLDRYTHSSKDGQRRVLDSFADFSLTEDDED